MKLLSTDKGSSAVEAAFVMPLFCFFLVLIVKFGSSFHEEMEETMAAHAQRFQKIAEWEIARMDVGQDRPCLESIELGGYRIVPINVCEN